MPKISGASPVVTSSSKPVDIPTGTFKASGDNVFQPFVEIRRQADGSVRLSNAAARGEARNVAGDAASSSWVAVFEKPGTSRRVDGGVDVDGNRFSSFESSAMRGGKLVQTEEITYQGSWLKKDLRTVREQTLSVENGRVVYSRRESTFEGRNDSWKLKFPPNEWQQRYDKT